MKKEQMFNEIKDLLILQGRVYAIADLVDNTDHIIEMEDILQMLCIDPSEYVRRQKERYSCLVNDPNFLNSENAQDE